MPTNWGRARRFREQADVYFPGAAGALLVQLRRPLAEPHKQKEQW